MKLLVGTNNSVKTTAVSEVIKDYPLFSHAEVLGISVPSGVSEQPLTLEETTQGAKNRAYRSFKYEKMAPCFGIGLESGLMLLPTTENQYMDICISAIYDGKHYHMGMSCGFRLPQAVSSIMLAEGLDFNQAMVRCGYTENPKLGAGEGAIGLFTGGRIDRKEYTKQCLITALISIEKNQYFAEFCLDKNIQEKEELLSLS